MLGIYRERHETNLGRRDRSTEHIHPGGGDRAHGHAAGEDEIRDPDVPAQHRLIDRATIDVGERERRDLREYWQAPIGAGRRPTRTPLPARAAGLGSPARRRRGLPGVPQERSPKEDAWSGCPVRLRGARTGHLASASSPSRDDQRENAGHAEDPEGSPVARDGAAAPRRPGLVELQNRPPADPPAPVVVPPGWPPVPLAPPVPPETFEPPAPPLALAPVPPVSAPPPVPWLPPVPAPPFHRAAVAVAPPPVPVTPPVLVAPPVPSVGAARSGCAAGRRRADRDVRAMVIVAIAHRVIGHHHDDLKSAGLRRAARGAGGDGDLECLGPALIVEAVEPAGNPSASIGWVGDQTGLVMIAGVQLVPACAFGSGNVVSVWPELGP